jgi:hypothetical protein
MLPSSALKSFSIPDGLSDYSIQSNIIYRFTKYINWPDKLKTGDFIVGVYGNEDAYNAFERVTINKSVGTQKIIVKELKSITEIHDCNILFITEDESNMVKKVCQMFPDRAILIVTEETGMASKGACINLVMEEEHLKLEINKNNIEKRNLKIATELLGLATIIQ